MTAKVDFTLNGESAVVEVPDDELLLDTLRDRFRTTSVRYSCGIGVCGSCTVLLDEAAVSSCLQLTQMVRGRQVRTAESVRTDACTETGADAVHRRVHDAFVAVRAFQCSYCIPAMALTVTALLTADPHASAEQIRDELAGNICRCGSYPQVLEAVSSLTPPAEETTPAEGETRAPGLPEAPSRPRVPGRPDAPAVRTTSKESS